MKHTLAAVVLSLSAAQGALAADTGLYLYGSAGWTDTAGRKAQADTTITNLGITAFTSSADEKDKGYKLQAGYRFNRYLGIEGGYADLGKYTYNAASTAPVVATRAGKGTIDAWTLAAVGSLPVGQSLALIGKLGVASYKLKFRCDGTGIACTNPDRRDRDTTPYYGVGLEWAFAPAWFLRGEYEVVQKVGESFNAAGTTGTSRADLKMGSIGVGYRF